METFKRKITVIPANPKYDFKASEAVAVKRRAAYARVSTDSEEQMTSYTSQCKYYTELLSNMPNTEFVGIYADEGVTGVSTKKRKEFQRLINDCREGLIDEIWVKSVSRFARNTLDCVAYIRELRELGVNVHFETLNIDTIDAKGEFLITILATLAQEESRNISENVRWAMRKKKENGEMMIAFIYGYRKSKDKILTIEPEEAVIVRRVFQEYLDGYTAAQIAARLNEEGIPTYFDKEWRAKGIITMLEQEKYKGDALLQKTYMANFLSKQRKKVTDRQQDQRLVENSHPPIVDRETYDKVQAEMKRRKETGEGVYSAQYAFSTMIRCHNCGNFYRRHAHYIRGKTYRTWICKNKIYDKEKCHMKPIRETDIEKAFVRALNRLISDKDALIADILKSAAEVITDQDQADYDRKMVELDKAREEMLELNRPENRRIEGYREQLSSTMQTIEMLMEETKFISELIDTKKLAKHRMDDIRTALESDMLNEFDERIFRQLITGITAYNDRELEFEFVCGIKVREKV